jgi:hypothetical protein
MFTICYITINFTQHTVTNFEQNKMFTNFYLTINFIQHNFWSCYCHLYSSCSNIMQR